MTRENDFPKGPDGLKPLKVSIGTLKAHKAGFGDGTTTTCPMESELSGSNEGRKTIPIH